MTVFLGLLTFTFLILTVISGFWWFIADHNDKYNDPRKGVRLKAFLFSLAGFVLFFWLIY